jgi:OmpA family
VFCSPPISPSWRQLPPASSRGVLDIVRRHPNATVTITGYTDSDGTEAYNLDLSRRRGQAVADWLVGQTQASQLTALHAGRGCQSPDGAERIVCNKVEELGELLSGPGPDLRAESPTWRFGAPGWVLAEHSENDGFVEGIGNNEMNVEGLGNNEMNGADGSRSERSALTGSGGILVVATTLAQLGIQVVEVTRLVLQLDRTETADNVTGGALNSF